MSGRSISAHMKRMNATKPTADELAAERFRTDTAGHVMEVALDQGLYRHLRFRTPGTGFCWFEIITTPGQLTIRGDMGTYVFSRNEDMFAFFEGNGGRINPSYWAEKVQAQDSHSPVLEYSKDLFAEHVLEGFWNSRENLDDASGVWKEIREQLLDDVYGPAGDETLAITTAMDFNVGGFEFYEVAEWRLKAYSFHYLYSLHAIVDGIRRYREHAQALQQTEAA